MNSVRFAETTMYEKKQFTYWQNWSNAAGSVDSGGCEMSAMQSSIL